MDLTRDEDPSGFPWLQAVILVAAASLSMLGVGRLGAIVGEELHERNEGTAPYTAEQLRSMEMISPDAAGVAALELATWNEGLEVGRSVARVQGEIVATLVLMLGWAAVIAIWLWRRNRARLTQRLLEEDWIT